MLPALFTRSQGLRKLYGNLCAPLLARYGLTQLELDIILFLANNPEYDTARILSRNGILPNPMYP